MRYEIDGEYTVGYDDSGTERERFFTTQQTIPVEQRFITVGALYDRLTTEKLNVLSSADAMIKALILDCSVRKYIDLDRPDLLQGLEMIASKGFSIDPTSIVSAPIQYIERP